MRVGLRPVWWRIIRAAARALVAIVALALTAIVAACSGAGIGYGGWGFCTPSPPLRHRHGFVHAPLRRPGESVQLLRNLAPQPHRRGNHQPALLGCIFQTGILIGPSAAVGLTTIEKYTAG